MKGIIAFVLLFIVSDDINQIATINRLKKEAENAYQAEEYSTAASNYKILYDSLGQHDDNLLLNLSNSYYKLNDTSNAEVHYAKLTETNDKNLRSIAYQQLGVLSNDMGKHEQALEQFKNSLRANPDNEDSRYNYELLKKLMQEQEQNQDQQDQQNQDEQERQDQDQQNEEQQDQEQQEQQNEEQQNQDQQDQENEKQQEQEEQQQEEQQAKEDEEKNEDEEQLNSKPEDMQEMEISEEMAKMILEAMRNNEIQYIQQNKRKPKKPKDSGKPDW